MVDCRPKETLSVEAELRETMFFEGWRFTMSSRKECNVYFIISKVLISYTTSRFRLLNYYTHRATFSLNVNRCYDVAKNAATAAIGFSISSVSAHNFHRRHFLNVTLPNYSPCRNCVTSKNVARSIDQSDHRKLTWGMITFDRYLKRFRPLSMHNQCSILFTTY